MTFWRESVALPVARSMTHHHALRSSCLDAFKPSGFVSLAFVSSGETGISNDHTYTCSSDRSLKVLGSSLATSTLLRKQALCSPGCCSDSYAAMLLSSAAHSLFDAHTQIIDTAFNALFCPYFFGLPRLSGRVTKPRSFSERRSERSVIA
jgi:hypothetical protein